MSAVSTAIRSPRSRPSRFSRGQPARRTEDLIPDEGQQLKGDKMIAALLGIVQHAAGDGQHRQQQANGAKADGHAGQNAVQQRVGAQHGDKNGAEEACHAQQHGGHHHGGQRLDQPHQTPHNGQIAAGLFLILRHGMLPPFRNFPVLAAGSTGGRRCRPPPAGLRGYPVPPGCHGPARRCCPPP